MNAQSVRQGVALALLVCLAAAAAGCAPKPDTILIHDLQFDPKTITVAAGTTVTWLNQDQTAHTITTDGLGQAGVDQAGQFTSEPLDPGQSFRHTFSSAGEFKYHCTIHPYIKGTVIVR